MTILSNQHVRRYRRRRPIGTLRCALLLAKVLLHILLIRCAAAGTMNRPL